MKLGQLSFQASDFKPLMDWTNEHFANWANMLLAERMAKEETIEIKKGDRVYIGRVVCLEEKDDCSDSKGAYP